MILGPHPIGPSNTVRGDRWSGLENVILNIGFRFLETKILQIQTVGFKVFFKLRSLMSYI